MDELYLSYRVHYVAQKEIVKERLIAAVVDSLDSLSDVVCGQLLSMAESYRHLNALTGTQHNQELIHAQNIVQEAGRVYGQQLASTLTQGLDSLNILPSTATGSVDFNQPTADISISVASTQVNNSTNQSNEDSDDEDMSVKSEINSEDECLSDSDVDVKEEPDETQTETEINQSDETATVKDEIESSSDSESDSDSDGYESHTVQVKDEDQEGNEIRSIDNSNSQDSVPDGSANEESASIAQSDDNVETVDSNEVNNEHQADKMMMGDEENAAEEGQDEPTITVANNQDYVPDGSFEEEFDHISQQEGNGHTVDSHMIDSQENEDEDSSGQVVLNEQQEINIEASNESGQAGSSIVSNTAPTLTRRSTRASLKKINYAGAVENSLAEPQDILQTGTPKRKRSDGRSGLSNATKRSRVGPTPTVAVEETVESEDEEDDDEPEAISLSVIVRRLNCRVPGCKKVFSSKGQLDGHLQTKHDIEKYACKVKDCTESYTTWTELTTHRNDAHENLDTDWPCGQCEVTCNTYNDLCSHTWQYHEYGQFACSADKCDYTEKTRIKVQNHQLKHRPAKYRCTYAGCSSSFNQKSHLTTHLRVHSKEKPFSCSQCPKAFAQKSHLTAHERVHSGLKPFSCTWPHCDYSASQRSDVIKHIRCVHFGLPSTKKKQSELRITDNRDARLFVKKTTGN